MSVDFRKYTHVERMGRTEVCGILDGHVIVQPKLDGSNGCVWCEDGEIRAGSRNRELGQEKDNNNFYNYIINSDDIEVEELRNFLVENPRFIIYGEWMGNVPPFCGKFIGSIKRYLRGGFFIFDVFDVEKGDYVKYDSWSSWLAFYSRKVPVIAEFDNPTNADIESCIEKCGYNLPDGVMGEGIVIKSEPTFRDKYGNIQIAKIVRDEYRQEKSKPKVAPAAGDIEQEFVYKYVTDAFLDKCRNKVEQACGVDSFDYRNKKQMGMMISLAWKDAVDENMFDFVKKKKPVVNFATLNSLISARVRKFLGL